jgi:membrane protease subunit HflC
MGRALLAIVVVGAILVIGSAAYQVFETEQVILTQFGKPVGAPVSEPGLHFKIPLIRKVHRFDRRFLEWDGKANQLPTKDKRFIWADTYARWRITDPLLFFQRLQNERGAQSRLDDILDGETRNAIANHELVELVRTSNRTPELDESLSEGSDELVPIVDGREAIRREILAAAQTRTEDLGIEILDVQFKRINYVEEVQEKVYDRMIAERRRIADRFRSEGEGESARIRGELERDLNQIESEAFKTAEEIKGRADAEATSIYAAAYDRSADSRRFYEFLKSMETLELTASSETSILLSTEGELYRFLQGSDGR